MIVCHGNGEDIGHIDPSELSNIFNVNVCVFDYSGYGLHSCKIASEASCQEDIIAVYNYLVQMKKADPKHIVLYGRSLGTYFACYLANYLCNCVVKNTEAVSDKINHPPAKLILVSPLMSAAKTVMNIWSPIDILMSYKLAPYITCPTLILHGDKDTIVPYSCGVELSQLFPNLYQFITLNNIGHNNIPTSLSYSSIEKFLRLG
jgi:pimeloyl-ACP methyl ester carboxylesterase